jgi:catechol 2,3-dioxygenase-like lactoylglutathione lyase family enzyme
MSHPLPGHIRQIGYVVNDLDAALKGWVDLGVGPWFVLRGITQRAEYRGQLCEATTTIALANSGELQIELIQQTDATPSVYTEFLTGGHEGFHQVAYWAEDFDAALLAVRQAGWPVVWSSADDGGVRYAYFEPPAGTAAVVELMEFNEVTKGLAEFVRDAADSWDGSDPIRPLN